MVAYYSCVRGGRGQKVKGQRRQERKARKSESRMVGNGGMTKGKKKENTLNTFLTLVWSLSVG